MIACEDPFKNDTFLAFENYPTGTYLENRSEDFSKWIEILRYTDLFNAINESSETYTVFVPNNAAVETFYKRMNVSSVEELGEYYASELVKFHLINAKIEQSTIIEGGKLTTPTVSENYLEISIDDENAAGGINSLRINGEALIIEMDTTLNGLVYVLDAVLTPLTETLYERLLENENRYSIFIKAIEATSWQTRLNTPYDTTYTISGSRIVTKRSFTLFTVSDETFAKNGIYSLEDLDNQLRLNIYSFGDSSLYEYMSYHLLQQTYLVENLFNFSEGDSILIWDTQATNQVFTTNKVDEVHYINYNYETEEGLSLVEAYTDIEAKNGIIQEVNDYMPIFVPNLITVIWDLCDYDEIQSIVNRYGSENGIGEIFQQIHPSTEQQVDFTPYKSTMETYQWTANSSSSISKWNALGYLMTKAGSNGNTYGAYKNDFLIVNLGYLGNFTVMTPTILKGKYKVELFFGYATSLDSFRNGGSQCQFSFEDIPTSTVQKYIYETVTNNTVGVYNIVLWDEIEFEITTKHTFKLVLMDSRASSNSDYRLQLDYVKFTPLFD
ncbi:MAG: DUF5108 domain-containing protein [Odoribacter sp.]|nr:DUF5108 domain-containing protein [Odoribacter sp.]